MKFRYLAPQALSLMLDTDFKYVGRLVYCDLVCLAASIRTAMNEYTRDPQATTLSELKRVLEEGLSSCLERQTFRGLWFQDISRSGLMTQLVRVVKVIPEGYRTFRSGPANEYWPAIHGILHAFLVHECHLVYGGEDKGYTFDNLHWWGVLYATLEDEYPPGYLKFEIATKLARMDGWSDHLLFKVEEGDFYRRSDDPYYRDKWERFLARNPGHLDRKALLREARREEKEYECAVMGALEREEYNSDSGLSDDELSTDAESDGDY